MGRHDEALPLLYCALAGYRKARPTALRKVICTFRYLYRSKNRLVGLGINAHERNVLSKTEELLNFPIKWSFNRHIEFRIMLLAYYYSNVRDFNNSEALFLATFTMMRRQTERKKMYYTRVACFYLYAKNLFKRAMHFTTKTTKSTREKRLKAGQPFALCEKCLVSLSSFGNPV